MKTSPLVMLTLFLTFTTACGNDQEPEPKAEIVAQVDPQTEVLEASLERYRAVCRQHLSGCDAPVVIEANPFLRKIDDTLGRCDASWEGTTLVRKILISTDALSWPTAPLDLLVAHEAEHCVRGVAHDETGEVHLMRPGFFRGAEAKAKTYAEWLRESFDAPTGDPTEL